MFTLRAPRARSAAWLLVFSVAMAVSAQEPMPPGEDPSVEPILFSVRLPDDVRVASCEGAGVAVEFPAPVVVSTCAVPAMVTCTPPSGTVFPVGTTVVNCSVSTECGERFTGRFTVTVVADVAAPAIRCPERLVVATLDPAGMVVDYELPVVTDDADPAPAFVCDPPPGSMFPMGLTEVTCTATDACGNASSCRFMVEVQEARIQLTAETISDPAGGSVRPALRLDPGALRGMDSTEDLGGEWAPLSSGPVLEPLDLAAQKFFRPPSIEGAVRGPDTEIAYVQVGLLAAPQTPGLRLLRLANDNDTAGGVVLLAGDSGGGGNAWSAPQNLPFTFRFFGRPYQQFRVSKNGLLTFSTNIVTGQEGLSYFGSQANVDRLTNALPLSVAAYGVDNTVFCLAGRYVGQTGADDVRGYVYGAAPTRQVWIVWRHSKDVYGQTVTGLVLEEGSNRLLIMDMDRTNAGSTNSRLMAGIQGALGSAREVRQVAATPFVWLVSPSASSLDNGCYLFRPYEMGYQVSGAAAPEIVAATNLNLLIRERMRDGNVPGCTVAVSRGGRLIVNRAYGWANVEKGELMKPYHRACIGSVSKVLAAVGVEKLIDQGKIGGVSDWAYAPDRLGKPWFWEAVNEALARGTYNTNGGSTNMAPAVSLNTLSNITIRHLLSHTAALANRNDDRGAAGAYAGGVYTNLTPQQQVRWFVATQPHLTNGVARLRQYSNPSFKQVGVLIEEVAGQPFESWMLSNVLIPGGAPFMRLMRTYEAEETWRDARRYHHYTTNSPWVTSRITGILAPPTYGDAKYDNAADGGAGSWTGTAADLVRLMAGMDFLPNRKEFLSVRAVNEIDVRAFPAVHATQGIGWDSSTPWNNRVEKNGNIGYGSAHLMRSTGLDRLTVAVVVNSGVEDPGGSSAATVIARAVFDAVAALPPVDPSYDLFPMQLQAP